MRYPIVLFDIGNTLVGPRDSYGAVYGRVLASLGIELRTGLLERCIRETSAEMSRGLPPGTDRFSRFAGGETEYWGEFFRRVFRRATGCAVEDSFAERALGRLWAAFGEKSAWRVFDDVVPALNELRREGARLGVVSNWDSRLPRLLEILDLAGYFETIGVSQIEQLEKPDPNFFLRVLDRLGGRPEDALHVGDVPELDLAGANAAGVDAVVLDRGGRLGRSNGSLSDLDGLPEIVRAGLT